MSDFVQYLVAGISIGAIYSMIAMGFVLLWQTSKTINFAQGDFVVLPSFAMVLFWVVFRLPFLPALLATIAVSTLLLGVLVKKLLIARLLDRGLLPVVVATLGLALLIRYSLQQFWTPLALPFPPVFSRQSVPLGGIDLPWQSLMNVLCAGLVILALHLFLSRTRLGWALQAIAQNRPLALVLGINVEALLTLVFVVNAALTAAAAVLIAPIYLVKYDLGVGFGLKAFYAAIIGGFNSMRGALLGGLLVGVIETLTAAYVTDSFRDGFTLIVLFLVLMVKPEGIWGVKEEWS